MIYDYNITFANLQFVNVTRIHITILGQSQSSRVTLIQPMPGDCVMWKNSRFATVLDQMPL